jgi:hypothetical protein
MSPPREGDRGFCLGKAPGPRGPVHPKGFGNRCACFQDLPDRRPSCCGRDGQGRSINAPGGDRPGACGRSPGRLRLPRPLPGLRRSPPGGSGSPGRLRTTAGHLHSHDALGWVRDGVRRAARANVPPVRPGVRLGASAREGRGPGPAAGASGDPGGDRVRGPRGRLGARPAGPLPGGNGPLGRGRGTGPAVRRRDLLVVRSPPGLRPSCTGAVSGC